MNDLIFKILFTTFCTLLFFLIGFYNGYSDARYSYSNEEDIYDKR